METFFDRHRGKVLAALVVAAIGALIWLETAGRGLPEGTEAPAFGGQLLDGTRLDQSALQGRPVVLDFWASWCTPCRTSLPKLDALAARYEGRAAFVAVNAVSEEPALQRSFVGQIGLRMPVVPDGVMTAGRYQVDVLPTTVLLDREGKVARTFTGAVSADVIEHALEDLL